MEISKDKQREYIRRLLAARMSVLSRHGFFGLLLMHMKFTLDDSIETAATDGDRIYFAPSFLDDISDKELIFILMHEIMHVALRHVFRTGERDNLLFNIACDIVVNSNIMSSAGKDPGSITLSKYGESMHLAPDGNEGLNYTAEEVYEMLAEKTGKSQSDGSGSGRAGGAGDGRGFSDDHARWGRAKKQGLEAEWNMRIREAYEAVKGRSGSLPLGIERQLKEMMNPVTDWRAILNDFVQEEVVDYSFAPPDRRFSESPFFLPDFNETEISVKNILFMVDTSGSMSDDEITQAYSEIKGAIDQFGGRLEGMLGFFDAAVTEPKPFTSFDEFKLIRPKGGGGTSFECIFDYVRGEMSTDEIASIIILTDGLAHFPDEQAAMGIPVLWMINNEAITPPWGRLARI